MAKPPNPSLPCLLDFVPHFLSFLFLFLFVPLFAVDLRALRPWRCLFSKKKNLLTFLPFFWNFLHFTQAPSFIFFSLCYTGVLAHSSKSSSISISIPYHAPCSLCPRNFASTFSPFTHIFTGICKVRFFLIFHGLIKSLLQTMDSGLHSWRGRWFQNCGHFVVPILQLLQPRIEFEVNLVFFFLQNIPSSVVVEGTCRHNVHKNQKRNHKKSFAWHLTFKLKSNQNLKRV